ncbi:hypothetical protein Mp_1g26920 [Marchantia polymorpha subsp. ruderalis]|uniref:Uncharacterized protein n=2 Tax=Marchantia polymorpha TaxID=3197 RepID=A0AAF6AUP5_MARPO|nr:hypothetical protein MARPO_0002s0186 [Marchantia polymorpha]BBN00166.1 hypothetical protein Mp_1g26920 [Marchantia polymorpha subsp. ruderalis]|eukprot:PTQ49718.1 hypothetical protein MARPO_0002s0186 [Marchantia polymorpha]
MLECTSAELKSNGHMKRRREVFVLRSSPPSGVRDGTWTSMAWVRWSSHDIVSQGRAASALVSRSYRLVCTVHLLLVLFAPHPPPPPPFAIFLIFAVPECPHPTPPPLPRTPFSLTLPPSPPHLFSVSLSVRRSLSRARSSLSLSLSLARHLPARLERPECVAGSIHSSE